MSDQSRTPLCTHASFAQMNAEELTVHFRMIADAMKMLNPPKTLFFVCCADLTPDGNGESQYVSNILRKDAVKYLRETADRLEQNQVHQREEFPK